MIERIAKQLKASWDREDDLVKIILLVAIGQAFGWITLCLAIAIIVAFSS